MGLSENVEEKGLTKNRYSKDHLIVKFPMRGNTGKKLWDRVQQLSELKALILQNFEQEAPEALGTYLNTNARLVALGIEATMIGNHLNFVIPRSKAEMVSFLEDNLPKWAKVKKRLR
jgi:hypothetical protein